MASWATQGTTPRAYDAEEAAALVGSSFRASTTSTTPSAPSRSPSPTFGFDQHEKSSRMYSEADLVYGNGGQGTSRTAANARRTNVADFVRVVRTYTLSPGRPLAKFGISCVATVVVLGFVLRAIGWSGYGGRPDQGRVWSKFGDPRLVDLSTVESRLPPCDRTMLVDWRTFGYGFGSTATTILHAGVVAKMHNYTLLFAREPNKYGRYLDSFEPAPLECFAHEELYDPAPYRKDDGWAAGIGQVINDEYTRPTIDRLLVSIDDVHPLNHHISHYIYPEMKMLDSLPPLDASRPVPISSNVPKVFLEAFKWYAGLSSEHFQLNGQIRAKLNGELSRLGLDKSDRKVPSIGVHWRGGDKLERECIASSQMSCGNVTHHCDTAYDALPAAYRWNPSLAPGVKPRLLLMTTEPDAVELFRNDPSCQRFDVEPLEAATEDKHSFVQDQWNALAEAERSADVQSMFVGAEILAHYVDVAVVSPNSNLARIIFARAGPQRVREQGLLRSVDMYWHPVHYPPFKATETWGGCDGTWGGCFPRD